MAKGKGKRKRSRARAPDKRGGSKKDKRIPIGLTLGALSGLATLVLEKNDSGSSVMAGTKAMIKNPTQATLENDIRIAKGTDLIAVGTPVILGLLVTVGGSKLGLNKYVRKVPYVGKKVKL